MRIRALNGPPRIYPLDSESQPWAAIYLPWPPRERPAAFATGGDGTYIGGLCAGRAGDVWLRVSLDSVPIGPPTVIPIVPGNVCARFCCVRLAPASVEAHVSAEGWAALQVSSRSPDRFAKLPFAWQADRRLAVAERERHSALGIHDGASSVAAHPLPSQPLPQLTLGVGETAHVDLHAFDEFANPLESGGTAWEVRLRAPCE